MKLIFIILLTSTISFSQSMHNSIGVITLSETYCDSAENIEILNEDGSIWKKFKCYCYDRSERDKCRQTSKDLNVLQYGVVIPLLKIMCIEQSRTHYMIRVNDKIKFIEKSRLIELETWDEYVLSSSTILYNSKTNPVLDSINGSKVDSTSLKRGLLKPIETNGKWLKLCWTTNDNNGGETKHFGWIIWKENNQIIVELMFLV